VPGPVEIDRSGGKAKPKGQIVTDMREMAAWFARNK
jgi:hypothetical protein